MTAINTKPVMRTSIEKVIDKVVKSLSELDQRYDQAEPDHKRHIVCSLYPKKLNFDGSAYRTPQSNTVVDAILLINREIKGIKKGKEGNFKPLSLMVARTVLKSNQIFEDLVKLASINRALRLNKQLKEYQKDNRTNRHKKRNGPGI